MKNIDYFDEFFKKRRKRVSYEELYDAKRKACDPETFGKEFNEVSLEFTAAMICLFQMNNRHFYKKAKESYLKLKKYIWVTKTMTRV